jgi:hypothetical protein
MESDLSDATRRQRAFRPGRKRDQEPTCAVCGVRLSAYNPGPNCWNHTIGHPWRGPSAKPRF